MSPIFLPLVPLHPALQSPPSGLTTLLSVFMGYACMFFCYSLTFFHPMPPNHLPSDVYQSVPLENNLNNNFLVFLKAGMKPF